MCHYKWLLCDKHCETGDSFSAQPIYPKHHEFTHIYPAWLLIIFLKLDITRSNEYYNAMTFSHELVHIIS